MNDLENHLFRGSLPYRLLRPEPGEPGQRYPLVLLLHGAGERGDDNERQLIHGVPAFVTPEARRRFPCFLVVPQCPADDRWINLEWGVAGPVQPLEPAAPLRLVLDLLDTLTDELPVDPQRLYVTGISMGGYGTWDLCARRPERVAAAVVVCGGADPACAGRLAPIPQWIFHGALDDIVPPDCSRLMVTALRQAGGQPRYTEYPEVGHDSWTLAYQEPDLLPWLFAQRRD